MLPAKERQPTTRAKRTSTPFWVGTPMGRSCRYSESEMTAAAAPPTPLKMATIWGMPVIGTLRAVGTATRAPRPMPAPITQSWPGAWTRKVRATATTMPATPTRLP